MRAVDPGPAEGVRPKSKSLVSGCFPMDCARGVAGLVTKGAIGTRLEPVPEECKMRCKDHNVDT